MHDPDPGNMDGASQNAAVPGNYEKFNLGNRAITAPLVARRCSAKGYSITSLARTRRTVGTVRPSVFAVLRLISNSYLAGACTGNSPGFSPLRTRSTYEAERRTISSVSGPYEISLSP